MESHARIRWTSRPERSRNESRTTPRQRQTGVLVVEGQVAVRGLLRTALEHEGFRALPAASGEEALEHFCQQPQVIDIVLLDTVLPGIDFIQTLRALRAVNSRVRFCLMTNAPVSIEPLGPAESGGLCVLRKPFHLGELLLTIRALAGQPCEPARPGPILPFQLYHASPPGLERRGSVRQLCRLAARCWSLGDMTGMDRAATVWNLSSSGVSLTAGKRFEPGKVAVAQVQNASRTFARTLLVQVIHARHGPGAESWVHGCSFCDRLSEDALRSLLS